MPFFYFPLIAFKWIPWSKEKKIQICFLRLLCHMMQVIQFHTVAGSVLSICLILWQLLPFSLQTLLHQGLWAFHSKQCCHSWSYSLIYTISNSIVVLSWWLPPIKDLIYLKVYQWHLDRSGIKEGEWESEWERANGTKEHWSGETECKIESKRSN